MAEDSSASRSSPPLQSASPEAHSSSAADDAKLSDKAAGGHHDAGVDNTTIVGKKGETKSCSH